MKEKEWSADGMKQIINTGHKTFDSQLVCVSPGNVIGGGQLSFYIRPYTETECNRYTFPLGYLQKYDLDHFDGLPRHIRRVVEELTHDRSLILYKFYHYNWRPMAYKEIVHGYIVTTGYPEYKLVHYWVTGPKSKSINVIHCIIPYITND